MTDFKDIIRPDLKNYFQVSTLELNQEVRRRINAGENICHLAFGQSPFPVPEVAQLGLKKHVAENDYLPVTGLSKLRELICETHSDLDNTSHFSSEQIVIGPGSKEIIFLIMRVFHGDIFILSPTWTSYLPQSKLAGNPAIIIHRKEEDRWRVNCQRFEEDVKRLRTKENGLVILCNPDNPTGICYSREELQSLAEVCRKLRLIVVADEVYAWTNFKQSFSSVSEFYPEGTIVTSGFSKWSNTGGWRIGYGLFPTSLHQFYDAVKSGACNTYSCAPGPMQFALIELLSDRAACKEYTHHTSRILHAMSKFVHESLTEVGVSVVPGEAGVHIMPNFEVIRSELASRGVTNGQDMCKLILEECGVALMPGYPAFYCEPDSLTVRLCFVDFDGNLTLEESRRIGLDKPLPADFVEIFCGKMYHGIQTLCRWVASGAQTREMVDGSK